LKTTQTYFQITKEITTFPQMTSIIQKRNFKILQVIVFLRKSSGSMKDYFKETKKLLEEKIPDYDTPQFKKLRNKIREKLEKKESDFLIIIRSLSILILGDWYNKEKKELLLRIKNNLLKNGLYAETIDKYYDIKKKGGLGQIQILEECCINHQLIIFIDGDGKGTIIDQNYICENYWFHGKVIFFIEESKFNKMKNDPSKYIRDFPTIITYKKEELLEKILVFSRLRLYRLANIIQTQKYRGRGLYGQGYVPWKYRIKKS